MSGGKSNINHVVDGRISYKNDIGATNFTNAYTVVVGSSGTAADGPVAVVNNTGASLSITISGNAAIEIQHGFWALIANTQYFEVTEFSPPPAEGP